MIKDNYYWILFGIAVGIIIYLIDKYFGNTSAVFAYSVLKLFKSSDNDSDIEYENIRKRLREISIKLDRLEAIKGI